jgi:hypothetical protein
MSKLRRAGFWIARVLAGLFVLWQLIFLFGLNFCEVGRHYLDSYPDLEGGWPGLADEESPLRRRVASFERVLTRWSELTNQTQSWSLFAPNVWSNIPFVAVEFRWDEEPSNACAAAGLIGVLAGPDPFAGAAWYARAEPRPPAYLLSDNEPPDIARYFKVGRFRLRRYEGSLDVNLAREPDKPVEDNQDKWRQSIMQKVRGEAATIRAYLQWRWGVYQASQAERETPKQIILHLRVYRIPPPPGPRPWTWEGPEQFPLARWRPHVAPVPGVPPVEVYDLIAQRYDMLP